MIADFAIILISLVRQNSALFYAKFHAPLSTVGSTGDLGTEEGKDILKISRCISVILLLL